MKVKIVSDFRDKYDYSRLYKSGDVVTFNDERANELEKLGLVKPFKDETPLKEEEEPKDETSGRVRKNKEI